MGSLIRTPYQRLLHPRITEVSLLSAVTDLVSLSAPTFTCLLQAWSSTQDGETKYGDGPTGCGDGSTWEVMVPRAVGTAVPGRQRLRQSLISRKVWGQGQRLPWPLSGLPGLCRPIFLLSC